MDIGLGFFLGFMSGAVMAVVVAGIVAATRNAAKKTSKTPDTKVAPALIDPGTGEMSRRPTRAGRSGHTLVVEQVEAQELSLEKSLQEVRDLLLRLAEIVSGTGDASGKAASAFNSAREVIDHLDFTNPKHLAEAQRVLVGEIDRVIKSNAVLHSELDAANQGIAEQRRQIEELRVQARVDGLTRIPNRAAFDERLAEYIALLERTSMVFTLLMVDIDHFKKINDDRGHVNGDRILRGVASRISTSIRTNDFASRYGGEEFAVILPGTRIDEAMQVAERVRLDLARTKFRLDDDTIMLTISGGLAECGKGMTAEEIVAQADGALYQAKAAGRNRMQMAGDTKLL